MSIQFEDYSTQAKAALNDATIAWLHEAAGEVESQAKRNSRVNTGQTKGSFSNIVDEGAGEAKVGSSLENAIWEEYGTGEYALKGNGRKGGWFYKDEKGEGHFTRGKTPNRALQRAFDNSKAKLKASLEKILGSRMGIDRNEYSSIEVYSGPDGIS